jgi:hypothetical protein
MRGEVRAAVAVHAPVGRCVTVRMRMRRVACSVTASTCAGVPPGRPAVQSRHDAGGSAGPGRARLNRVHPHLPAPRR